MPARSIISAAIRSHSHSQESLWQYCCPQRRHSLSSSSPHGLPHVGQVSCVGNISRLVIGYPHFRKCEIDKWRKRQDSNLRRPLERCAFQVRWHHPLAHSSVLEKILFLKWLRFEPDCSNRWNGDAVVKESDCTGAPVVASPGHVSLPGCGATMDASGLVCLFGAVRSVGPFRGQDQITTMVKHHKMSLVTVGWLLLAGGHGRDSAMVIAEPAQLCRRLTPLFLPDGSISGQDRA